MELQGAAAVRPSEVTRLHRWASAASRWVRDRLGRRRASWEVAGLALIVLFPTLWSGLAIDDLFQRFVVEGKLSTLDQRLDLFDVVSRSPAQRARFEELGVYPWWIGPHTQVSYWRPVAAFTHFVDYSLWPRAAWLMHLENLAWYAALILLCAAMYRRFITVPWIAGFATAYYAFDPAHGYPAAWVANRNALMSTFFGVLCILAHDRWRTARRLWFGFLAWAAFGLALLSAEAGVAIAGYIIAYAIFFEGRGSPNPRSLRGRALSVVPYAVLVVAWRVAYRALGHGAVGSGANLDPLTDRAAFLANSLQSGPLLLASDVLAVPAEVLLTHPGWTTTAIVASIAALAFVGYAALPLLRADASARFLAAGAVLSASPFGGTFPSDRYLFWAGLGLMGVVAQLVGGLFGERTGPANAVRYAVCCACLFVRGLVSPALFQLSTTGPGLIEDDFERMVETIPRGPKFTEQTVVILNAPIDLFQSCLPLVAMAKRQPSPAHMYMLYAGADPVIVTRTAADTLEERVAGGWFSRFADRLFRSTPLQPGETVHLAAMSAHVESLTREGRPGAVRFQFPTAIDDSSLLLLSWGPHGFERVTPPGLGDQLTVAPAPLIMSEILRPHLRERAVED
jgi:hypothetical protein